METLGVICARGNSKGFPGKNLAQLAGLPVLAHSIRSASRSKLLSRTILSTDCEDIAAVGQKYGCDVPFLRPVLLATDDARIELALIHALKFCEDEESKAYDMVVLLQNTSPLRTVSDIDGCIDALIANSDHADSAATVHRIHHPHMLRWCKNSVLAPVLDGLEGVYRRQDAPAMYEINGLAYAVKRDYLLDKGRVLADRCVPYIVPIHRTFSIHEPYRTTRIASMDIDDAQDLEVAESLLGGLM